MTKAELPLVVLKSLNALGGRGCVVEVSKYIWDHYEGDLRKSGDLFYTWQYDVRWAAQRLRKEGKLRYNQDNGRSVWELA